MLITTTPSVEHRSIKEYKGIVFGESITGINFLKDFSAGLRNVFGGRSKGYEEELIRTRQEAMMEMEMRAKDLGAEAVIGIEFDYSMLGSDNGMMMVTCTGTAVTFE